MIQSSYGRAVGAVVSMYRPGSDVRAKTLQPALRQDTALHTVPAMNAVNTERAWWEDSCKTDDGQTHSYRATEYTTPAGTSIRITFQEYGSFTSYSEEDAIHIFKAWYKKNVEAPKPDLRDQIRKPSVRNIDTDLR